jgi:hypothetical protein
VRDYILLILDKLNEKPEVFEDYKNWYNNSLNSEYNPDTTENEHRAIALLDKCEGILDTHYLTVPGLSWENIRQDLKESLLYLRHRITYPIYLRAFNSIKSQWIIDMEAASPDAMEHLKGPIVAKLKELQFVIPEAKEAVNIKFELPPVFKDYL